MPQSQQYRKYNLPVSNPEPNTKYVEFRSGLYITGTRIMRFRSRNIQRYPLGHEMIRTAPYPINLALVEIIHWLRIIAISPRCSSAH
uniref:Uncharacterized protein n=1 Tax=Magallana gigas TaxID=29159 RepID=K1P925_MAGGI